MADINFCIPFNNDELLHNDLEKYSVKDVVGVKEVVIKLKDARLDFKDQGPEYILDHFDTYFSVVHHGEKLRLDVVMQAYEDLQRACEQLNNTVAFLLDDSDNLNDELKMKFLNVLKMLIFVFTKTVLLVEHKCCIKNKTMKYNDDEPVKGKGRKEYEDSFNIKDKNDTLLILNNLIQRNLHFFWNPPLAEENFVNLIAVVCYNFLENPFCKSEKDHLESIFNILGKLIKTYNHGMGFTIRVAQIIKLHNHIISVIPIGIKILVEQYQCKGLVREFIRELTEWQTEEKFQDTQGTKRCCTVLTEISVLMPDLMIPEMMYLMTYLNHESHTLRNAILNIITEMILKVFTKKELTEEQIEFRDDFLETLEDHIYDMTGLVRSKVFQNWAKLQEENAIPIKNQFSVMEKAVFLLHDKAAAVRKSAASLLTTFLQCNIFAANLDIVNLTNELENETAKYNALKTATENAVTEKLKKVEEKWKSIEPSLRQTIKDNIANPESAVIKSEIDLENTAEILKTYMEIGQYQDAFVLCKSFQDKFLGNARDEFEKMNAAEQEEFFLKLLREMFVTPSAAQQNEQNASPFSREQIRALEIVQKDIDYLNDAIKFITLIESAIPPMKSLITSATVGDVHEAIEFFIVAYKFSIRGAIDGVLQMLIVMRCNEQERKEAVIKAYKRIYLETDATTAEEHTNTIIKRLSDLVRSVTFEYYNDLSQIVSEWVLKSMLDNLVIAALWQVFAKGGSDVANEESRLAIKLLAMAATGKKGIISKNINLVVSVGFSERGRDDLKLFEDSCRIISVASSDKIDENDQNPCFRIDTEEEMWQKLIDILVHNFDKKKFFWNNAASAAMTLVFKLCRKPEKIASSLIEKTLKIMHDQTENEQISECLLTQFAHLVGEVAIQEFIFLDISVYKELKRRNNIREGKKNDNQNGKKRKNVNKKATASFRMQNDVTNSSIVSCTTDETGESEIEGAVAEDHEADFILKVCEKELVTQNLLGKFAQSLVKICQDQTMYQSERLQSTAVLALLRYMDISSSFCEQNLQLIFTLLERSEFVSVKTNIVISVADLLARFPNAIEPWTPRIFAKLRDPEFVVRKTVFTVLSYLIFSDMLRVKGHISEMCLCLIDAEEELREISRGFFTAMAKKGNNLYNVIPDIISRLTDVELKLDEEDFHTIMKFILGRIEKDKQMESLVERLCVRFKMLKGERQCRDIAFCLSLVQYNEKALIKLTDSLDLYKEKLHIDAVYATLKGIVNNCSKSTKPEVKRLAAELETKIEAVFDVNNENRNPNDSDSLMPPPVRPVIKKTTNRGRKKKTKVVVNDDEDEDLNGSAANVSVTSSRRSQRSKKTTARKANAMQFDSDSDSD